MNNVTWTKHSLSHSLNTRVDQGKFGKESTDYVLAGDISDEAVERWQEFYDSNLGNPMVIESEYGHLYQSIVAGF